MDFDDELLLFDTYDEMLTGEDFYGTEIDWRNDEPNLDISGGESRESELEWSEEEEAEQDSTMNGNQALEREEDPINQESNLFSQLELTQPSPVLSSALDSALSDTSSAQQLSQSQGSVSTQGDLSQLFDSFGPFTSHRKRPSPFLHHEHQRSSKKLPGISYSTSFPSMFNYRSIQSPASYTSPPSIFSESQQSSYESVPRATASSPFILDQRLNGNLEEDVEDEAGIESEEESAELVQIEEEEPVGMEEEQDTFSSPIQATTVQEIYQMGPIDSSLDTEEKRCAIIQSLEHFTLSMYEQLVNSIKKSIPVVVILAKRNKKSNQAIGNRSLKLPNGRSGGFGSKEFAILLKIIQCILEALKAKVSVTKRDIYYRNVTLFGRQAVVDTIIEDLAATLRVRRTDLRVIAAAKGLFAGCIELIGIDGAHTSGGDQGALIAPLVTLQSVVTNDCSWILIVEKEAVFRTLCTPKLLNHPLTGRGILITGKGYPDLSTRELIKYLSDSLPLVPILALLDSDPHGLQILSTYVHGSASMQYDEVNLAVPRIQWIGVKATEWDSIGEGRDSLLLLTGKERKLAIGMLKARDWSEEWKRDLSYMIHMGKKAEIQLIPSSRRVSPLDLHDFYSETQDGEAAPEFFNPLIEFVVAKIFEQL